MKRIFVTCFASAILFTACNNNKPAEGDTAKGPDTAAATTDADKAKELSAAMDKQKEELEKLTPVSLDELKAFIPETLMGAARASIDANANNGASLATGEYAINDSMQVILNVFDCAGPGGAGIYSMQFQGLEGAQQETAEEYTKAVSINGNKGFEHGDKTSNEYTITYFTAGRYLVVLEGKGVGAPALREAAGHLKFK